MTNRPDAIRLDRSIEPKAQSASGRPFTARAEQILAARNAQIGRLPGDFSAEDYLAALAAAEAEGEAAAEKEVEAVAFSPPRDLVAGALVHGVIQRDLAATGRRLESAIH